MLASHCTAGPKFLLLQKFLQLNRMELRPTLVRNASE